MSGVFVKCGNAKPPCTKVKPPIENILAAVLSGDED